MNDLCRDTLCRIVANFGDHVWSDADRCEGLIREFCEGFDAETQALVLSLRRNVPGDLLDWASRVPPLEAVAKLTARLQAAGDMFPASAKWAVESWALALRVATKEELASLAPAPAVAIQAAWHQELRPAGAPARPSPPPAPARSGVWPKALAAVAAAAVLVLVGAFVLRSRHAAPAVTGPTKDTWDPSRAKFQFALLRTWQNETGEPVWMAASPSGTKLAVCGKDALEIWDVDAEPPTGTKVGRDRWGLIAVGPDWDTVVRSAGSRNGDPLGLFGLDYSPPKLKFDQSGGYHTTAAFEPSGRYFMATCNGSIGVWEPHEGRQLAHITFDNTAWASARFLPGGDRLVLLNAPLGKVRLFKTETGAELPGAGLASGEAIVTGAAASEDGRLLACACNNGTIQIVDLDALSVRSVVPGFFDHISTLAFLPGGKDLLSADRGGRLQVWDVQERKEAGRLLLAGAKSPCFALIPGGDELFAPGDGTAIQRLKLLQIW